MLLVGQFDSPYVRRVGASLALLGIAFERDTRSVFRDADEMRKFNPLGRIPSLVLDDGEVLIESGAILDYLDELAGPARALLPRHGVERRGALRRIALATGTIEKALAIVYERALRPPELQFAPWLERCGAQAGGGLAALEAGTGDGWHGGSARPLQPDVTVGCLVAFLRHSAPDLFPPGAYPALEQLAAACGALPAFERTQPRDDELRAAPRIDRGSS